MVRVGCFNELSCQNKTSRGIRLWETAVMSINQITEECVVTYKNQLSPWCIIRSLPDLQQNIVARFRRRNDAESRLKILQKLTPNAAFSIVFDTSSNDSPQSEEK